jgi:cytochrome c
MIMKKLLGILFATALIYSCGESGEKKADEPAAADTTASTPAPPADAGSGIANEKGLELIGASDCTTCHAIDRKVIGPAYVDVAKKYENTEAVIDTLVSKIKKGGMGNWGNIPMTPHPDIPDADAKEMVKYILSLKNQQ